jgi:predicted RNA-binding Zn ribbon-like protein
VSKKRDAGSIKLIGGGLCLDFVNTVDCYGCADPGEYLNTYHDLVAWSRHVGTITHDEAETLFQKAAEHPAEAKTAHRRAIELREVIYNIFSATLEGRSHAEKDLAVFNDLLSKTMMRSQIVRTKGGFHWDMTGNKAKLSWILNPVIRSAADLLISEEFKRIKKCADPICGWLFLDLSRNRSRRWCDMRDCGNRAKANRFYKKKKPSRSRTIPARGKSSPSTPKPKLDRHLL